MALKATMTENMEIGDDPMQEQFSEDMQYSTHTKIQDRDIVTIWLHGVLSKKIAFLSPETPRLCAEFNYLYITKSGPIRQ